MAQANLVNTPTTIDTSWDNIVIRDNGYSIRGGYTLDVTGFEPTVIRAGHPIIEKTSDGTLKPMPVTTAAADDGIATLGTVVAGTGYANGTYENVPLRGSTTGTGALATVVVASTVVSTVTITKPGNNYVVADSLTADASYIGGTGSGFSVPVATIGDTAGAFASLPSGHTYIGVAIHSNFTNRPLAGIMTHGVVNHSAFTNASAAGKEGYYSYTAILSAIRTAIPQIIFTADR